MTISHIVCIDDERPILDIVVADIESTAEAFSVKYNVEINIEACTSGQECIDFINTCDRAGEDVACIITDVRMPNMTGDQLLFKLRETHPKAGKIIITGFSDLEQTIVKVKEELQLIKYLKKPYNPVTLRMSVARALDFFYRERSPVIDTGDFVFKEVEIKYELEQVFRLAYDIYIDELVVKNLNQLAEDERQKKQMFDDWDFKADTRHFIALKDGEAVGTVRVNYNDMPMEHYIHPDNVFELTLEHQIGITKTEISQLMIRKEFRSADLLSGLFRFVYHYVNDSEDIYVTNSRKYDSFFLKLGCKKLGEFYFDRLNEYYSVHHFYVPDFINHPEKLISIGLDSSLRKMIMEPLVKN
ncbi:response regulator [Desulfococcaceae bacterium HSG7]|nr:response regulator [Desulfococcaceae bacterium HSG7]